VPRPDGAAPPAAEPTVAPTPLVAEPAPPGRTASAVAPAAQLAAPLVTLAAQAAGGSVTVRLHPAELGQVEIQLQRQSDGATHVTLRAEHSDTLRALVVARPHIEAALDRAGVAAAGRVIAFDPRIAAPSPPPAAHAAASGPAGASSPAGTDHARHAAAPSDATIDAGGQAASHGGATLGGDRPTGGQGRGRPTGRGGDATPSAAPGRSPDPRASGYAAADLAGIDITA
jgi:hypothetical protein